MSWITILVVVAVGGAGLLMRSRRTSAPTITGPVLGILDLDRARFGSLASEDRTALGPLFNSVVESDGAPPTCDVLLLYCEIETGGKVGGSPLSLRQIIRDAGARVVIVAAENDPERYMEAAQPAGYGAANLVMALERKGDAFPAFFGKLFGLMFRGVSMPVAWAQLAPQIPGHEHAGLPESIFACELGQITFTA
ncbi:hypothetical protein [Longimicrobium sp.]|uniref:hypothetical protein n=1 Tax=Longimicrobium sp. TaxID=2029185 RepID=UPI003B3AE9F3